MRAISIVSYMLMLAAASLLVKIIFAVVHTVDDTKPPPPLLAPPVHERERFRCDWFALFFVFIGILEALILILDFATPSPAIVQERPVAPLPSSSPRVSPLDPAATPPHATRRRVAPVASPEPFPTLAVTTPPPVAPIQPPFAPAPPSSAAPNPPPARRNINTCTEEDLCEVRGIGKMLSPRIIEARPFEDATLKTKLLNIDGIGPVKCSRVMDQFSAW